MDIPVCNKDCEAQYSHISDRSRVEEFYLGTRERRVCSAACISCWIAHKCLFYKYNYFAFVCAYFLVILYLVQLSKAYQDGGILAYIDLVQKRERELGCDVLTHQKWFAYVILSFELHFQFNYT